MNEDASAASSGFRREVLQGSLANYARPEGVNLLRRTEAFFAWQDARRTTEVWPYGRSLDRAPGVTTSVTTDAGKTRSGVNFASQDYLSLASHPSVAEAAIRAIRDFGPHSAGSPVLIGNTAGSLRLERELGDFLQMEEVVLFPTGWAAGFASIAALVRPYDYVLMDQLAHACLQQGAHASTGNVRRHRHLDLEHVREQLTEIRAKTADAGVLVVSEGLFSMDSDWPELSKLQSLCREHDATLLVDVAHDLGALGPGGTGRIGAEGLLGEIDLVMGSFSKTFASNGGFLATHSRSVKQFVKYYGGPHTFSNAISPVQVAVVSEALRLVRSAEGDSLRSALLDAVQTLRDEFAKDGIRCVGGPSAIVPVPVGSEAVGRVASTLIFERGVIANLVEYPAVAMGASRFRMQVMAKHNREQAVTAATIIMQALREARAIAG